MNPLATACQALLAVVFGLAAFGKARNRTAFGEFVDSLAAFGLPRRLAGRQLAASIIAAEALVPPLLLLDRVAGCALAAGLLIAFTAGIAGALRRGGAPSCRCFGAASAPLGRGHLVRNGLLLSVAALGLATGLAGVSQPVSTSSHLFGAAVGLAAGVLVTRWDDLVYILAGPPRTRS